MNILLIIGTLTLIITIYAISTYNFFAVAKARIKASIQEIGNQLKRQADLIPNLESSVKGYLSHEKEILSMLSEARSASSNGQDQKASKVLGDLLPRLSVVVESNPELKGNTTVQNLMEELRDTADKVMYARRTLIDLSADYNMKLATFPTNLVAQIFGFREEDGLKVEEMDSAISVKAEETKSPKINL